jgi:hypothetical protein
MDIMMLGHVEYFGMLNTRGAKPPSASKASANMGELCSIRIMRRSTADEDASS